MKKEKIKLKLKGAIKGYLQWPLYLTALLLCMTLSIYVVNKTAAAVMLAYTLVYFLISMILFVFKRKYIMGELVRFGASYGALQRFFLKELDVPYGILDMEGHLLWANNELKDIVAFDKIARYSIREIFPDISLESLPTVEEDSVQKIVHEGRVFRVRLRLMDFGGYQGDALWEAQLDGQMGSSMLMAMYLYDETEITALKKENAEEKMVVGLLYIDNYDEVFQNVEEVKRSLVTAWVEREVNKYMSGIDAILKKLEKDKYIFMFRQKYMAAVEQNRFSILEEIRNLNIYELSVTISIGIGAEASTYAKRYELANKAINLALGRGGDQAVVMSEDKTVYYGGKSAAQEKTTRVKARVKAHALREYVEAKDKLLIMGHKMGDNDSLGAAIGIYRIAKECQKEAHIVVNIVTNTIRGTMERFQDNPEYEPDMFVDSAGAKELADDKTLVVVVDVSDPSRTECPELLTPSRTVLVLDHHRQQKQEKAIENPALSYIEPFASSTCEMVAEILQYIEEGGLKPKPAEADAMYEGIMIDTNNFLMKTGVRTFEAAAYLKRCGADVTKIRKRFRTDFAEYRTKMRVVSSAELFMDYYVFAEADGEGVDSPTVLAAQVSNELLNIDNIKASFVFTEFNGEVRVSARSIDELNVQVVMEKFGGGGHMSMAGAQFKDCTVAEAIERVKNVLKEMTEKGEI